MSIIVHKSSSMNPFYNFNLEQQIFLQCTKREKNLADVHLLFYENLDSIIIGKSLDLEKEIYIHKKNPFIMRRQSGGGSVVHFKGNLNYSIILSITQYQEFASIQNSYKILLKLIQQALDSQLNLHQKGISDLCILENDIYKKISGNAQMRKKKHLLHHGTIIYDSKEIRKINYYLRHPPVEPEYRSKRNHLDFLPRKIKLNPYDIKRNIVKELNDYFK